MDSIISVLELPVVIGQMCKQGSLMNWCIPITLLSFDVILEKKVLLMSLNLNCRHARSWNKSRHDRHSQLWVS